MTTRRHWRILLGGTVVLIPIIIAYASYAYCVFHGKVDPEEGYH